MTDKAVDKESSNVNDKDTAADGGESGASSSRLTTMSAKNCSDVKPSPSLSPASSSSGGSPTSSSSASHTHPPPASSNPPPASSNPPPASSNPPPASSDPSPASSNPPPTSSNPPPASSNSPPASVAANSRQRSSHSDSGQHASLSEQKVSDAKASAINSSLIVHRTRQCTRKNVANQHHTPSPSSSSSSSSGRHGSASTAKSSRINSRNVRHRDNDATGPSRVQDECRRTRTRSAGAVEHLEPSDLAQLVPVTELLVKPEPAPVLPTPTMPTGSSQPNQQHKPTANKPPAVEPTANKPPAVEPTASVTSQSAQNLVYNWQASKTTIRQRLSFMCDNSLMADIHFLVGKYPPQRIPAHKFVLSIGSAVFDAMFNGAMACEGDEVELPDVEPSAFLALLRFLYTDQVQIDAETVMTTLYTAKKYSVPALEEACVDFLKRNLSSDNAFMLLTQARLFDEPQLAGLCLEMIDKSTSEALNAEGFSDIDMSTLSVVLERDTLGIRESKLFAALQRWAQAECVRQDLEATAGNQRQVLGRALYQIRFPLMTVEEFAMGPAQSGLLRDRELVELFLHFTVNPKPRVAFEDTPRCCLTGKEQVVSRFCHVENRWGYSGTSDRIRFTVNRRIFVVGFGLYGSIHGPAEYTVNMQVIQTDSGNICGQNDTTFQSDGSMATFRVMFKEPIEIQPNSSYTACATLKGPDSYYGTKGLRKVTHESVSSGKVTFQFTYAAGNNNGSSVEDGQLPEIVFYT